MEFHNVRDGDDTLLTGAKYAYDEVGNIVGIYESQLVGTNTTRRPLALYTYDVQNQLTGETIYTYASDNLTATPTTTTVYAYTYDTAGNILTESKNGTVTKTYTYGNSDWNDLLTKYNNLSITYDAIGNPTNYANSKALYSFEWVNGRNLSYANVDGVERMQLSFAYDADGIRTSKTVDNVTHNYITQSGKVVRETIGTGTTAKVLDFIYDASGRPFALKYTNGTAASVTYYYVLNLQGDVIKLIEADGTVVAEYTYNAWGEILTATGTMAEINPLRYRGYYYDTETGFYYLQSRYYDPAMHRFINADAYASTGTGVLGYNMFAYCNNNPMICIDSAGAKAYVFVGGNSYTIYTAAFEITISYEAYAEVDSDEGYEVTADPKSNEISLSFNILDDPITIAFEGTLSDGITFSLSCSDSLSDNIDISSSIGLDSFSITVSIADENGIIHQISLSVEMNSPRFGLKEENALKDIILGIIFATGAALAIGMALSNTQPELMAY